MSTALSAQKLGQAFAALDEGRLTEARRLARALEDLRPEPPGLAYLFGLLHLAEGEGRKAAQHLKRALQATPEAIPPLLAMARAQRQQQRIAESRSAFRRLLALAPSLAVAWQELAALDLADGSLAAAMAPLRHAARIDPSHAATLNNLGIAARASGEVALARHVFLAAILLDPAAARPYANLAGLRRHLRQPASVEARYAVLLHEDGATQLELGQALAELADDQPALAAFQRAAILLPGQIEPLWLQAETLQRLGRNAEAIALCRDIIAQDPADRFGAALLLARLSGETPPQRASAALVSRLYDQYADSFETNLLTDLAYRAPEILLDAIRRCGLSGPFDVLDAGCGTGLMGQAIRPQARRLDGIDLSARMVEQARRRGIYDSLVVGDLLGDLASRRQSYDLLLAADVLIYFGDLTELCGLAAAVLRPAGAFAFTVERSDADEVHVQPNGRFAHSRTHISKIAASSNLTVSLLEETSTRRESALPVPGLVCILTRS